MKRNSYYFPLRHCERNKAIHSNRELRGLLRYARNDGFDKLRIIISALFFTVFFSTNCLAQENLELTSDKIDPSRFYTTASVQILNKTTAKSSTIDLAMDRETKFGTLSISARRCWKSSIDQKPESKILLEVSENQGSASDEKPTLKRIFYGWIFASSPSVSGLEHPIYDIIALNCKK